MQISVSVPSSPKICIHPHLNSLYNMPMTTDSDQLHSLGGGIARLRFERDRLARERDQTLLALDEANRRAADLGLRACRTQGALVGVSTASAGLMLVSLVAVIALESAR